MLQALIAGHESGKKSNDANQPCRHCPIIFTQLAQQLTGMIL
jgi:hypothetical protein